MLNSELIKVITNQVMTVIRSDTDSLVPVGVSGRHVHLSLGDMEILFGKGYELEPLRDLKQPGEFAAKETLVLVGPKKRAMENVRVLGPLRPKTQVELAKTDAILLGLNPPWRVSGQLDGSESVCLVGPKGCVYLENGVIIAQRHIHMPCKTAMSLGLKDNQRVSVASQTERPLIFQDVQIRTGENYKLEIHLDTDDANAAGLSNGSFVKVLLGGETG